MKLKTQADIEIAKLVISPPGDTLAETIDELKISQTELANRMGRPLKKINEIIQGKTAITSETAIQLERVTDIPANFWLEREKNYRLELAEILEAERLIEEKEWLKNFPLKEMLSLQWISIETKEPLECGGYFSIFQSWRKRCFLYFQQFRLYRKSELSID